ncbi:hypothetical protein BMS3Bbin13_00046 [bacterium BMS3Bbin13]|nr:hypothetical protein BMS3Bbin13_00046 [bacterium BMS3Bbin13]
MGILIPFGGRVGIVSNEQRLIPFRGLSMSPHNTAEVPS